MSRMMIWLLLSCKRWLKKPAFAVLLLMLPLTGLLVRNIEQNERTEIDIAVYAKMQNSEQSLGQKQPLEQKLAERLTASKERSSESIFHFYLCDSEEQVREDVAARRAESGYVVETDLRARLDSGNFKRCIHVYTAPSTVTEGLSSEVVLSTLLGLYDPELLENYVEEGELFEEIAAEGSDARSNLVEEVRALYEKWLGNGSTFHFAYQWTGGGGTSENRVGTGIFPVRGLVAVYLLVTGMYSAAINLADRKCGLFLAVSSRYRIFCRGISLAAPVLLAAGSGLVVLMTAGVWVSPGRELCGMAWYVAAVSVFSGVLQSVCRKEAVICGLIPFFLVGSLVFCPVFLDFTHFLPELAFVEKFFLPGYYLRWFM